MLWKQVCVISSDLRLSNVSLITSLCFRSPWCCSFVATSWTRRTSSGNQILSSSFTAVTKTDRKLTAASPVNVLNEQKQLSQLYTPYTDACNEYRLWAWFFTLQKASIQRVYCKDSTAYVVLHNAGRSICDLRRADVNRRKQQKEGWAEIMGQSWQEEHKGRKDGGDGVMELCVRRSHFLWPADAFIQVDFSVLVEPHSLVLQLGVYWCSLNVPPRAITAARCGNKEPD